jgi:hypothetical protein
MTGRSTILSWEWWLTVVILSVVLNLVAAYLKSPLDRIGGRFSSRWARRNATKRREREQRIARASKSQLAYLTLRFAASRARVEGVGLLLYGMVFVALTILLDVQVDEFNAPLRTPYVRALGVLGLTVGTVAFLLGTFLMTRATDLDREADEAGERLIE